MGNEQIASRYGILPEDISRAALQTMVLAAADAIDALEEAHRWLQRAGVPDDHAAQLSPRQRWEQLLRNLFPASIQLIDPRGSASPALVALPIASDEVERAVGRLLNAAASFLLTQATTVDDAFEMSKHWSTWIAAEDARVDSVETLLRRVSRASRTLLDHAESGTWRDLLATFVATPTVSDAPPAHDPQPIAERPDTVRALTEAASDVVEGYRRALGALRRALRTALCAQERRVLLTTPPTMCRREFDALLREGSTVSRDSTKRSDRWRAPALGDLRKTRNWILPDVIVTYAIAGCRQDLNIVFDPGRAFGMDGSRLVAAAAAQSRFDVAWLDLWNWREPDARDGVNTLGSTGLWLIDDGSTSCALRRSDPVAEIAGRLERQSVLYDANRHFEFLITETALRWRPRSVLALLAQPDRIASISTFEKVRIGGMIPTGVDVATLIIQALALYEGENEWSRRRGRHRSFTEPESLLRAAALLVDDDIDTKLAGLAQVKTFGEANPEHQQLVVNVLCGYLRTPAPELRRDTNEWRVRTAVQALLAEHLRPRPNPEHPPDHSWEGMDLDLNNAVLADLNLTGCHIRNARFTGARFHGATVVTAARFGCSLFDRAVFDGDAVFERVTFADEVRFERTKFREIADFRATRFDRDVRFDATQFGNDAVFTESVFEGDARFIATEFCRDALFDQATFSALARFERARFSAGARFSETWFQLSKQNRAHNPDAVLLAQDPGWVRTDTPIQEPYRVWPTGWTVQPTPNQPRGEDEGQWGRLVPELQPPPDPGSDSAAHVVA